jgi:hypothetical protein
LSYQYNCFASVWIRFLETFEQGDYNYCQKAPY